MSDKPKGFLVFTTHDRDEISAYFVPHTEAGIIEKLKAAEDSIMGEFGEWLQANPFIEKECRFHIQTECHEAWPFNDYHILGTFYHLVF
jgi:hypothetical protein